MFLVSFFDLELLITACLAIVSKEHTVKRSYPRTFLKNLHFSAGTNAGLEE